MIITVTGHSGSGKSTLAVLLSVKLNLKLIDVDEIVANMYDDLAMQTKLREVFGDIAEGENGKIEKRLVSKIVLNNSELWDKLDKITWSYLEGKIDEQLAECDNNAIIDYKFIPLTKYFNTANYNILVEAKNDKLREKYLIKRDRITKAVVAKRDSFSPEYNQHEFSFVILNNYTHDFVELCESLVRQIKSEK